MCSSDCAQLPTAAVALVDSGATHSFISEQLVSTHGLAVSQGQSMSVTLADGSSIEATEICVVPLVFCSGSGRAVSCTVECRVLSRLNHDVVLGHDWLHNVNPAINW